MSDGPISLAFAGTRFLVTSPTTLTSPNQGKAIGSQSNKRLWHWWACFPNTQDPLRSGWRDRVGGAGKWELRGGTPYCCVWLRVAVSHWGSTFGCLGPLSPCLSVCLSACHSCLLFICYRSWRSGRTSGVQVRTDMEKENGRRLVKTLVCLLVAELLVVFLTTVKYTHTHCRLLQSCCSG